MKTLIGVSMSSDESGQFHAAACRPVQSQHIFPTNANHGGRLEMVITRLSLLPFLGSLDVIRMPRPAGWA